MAIDDKGQIITNQAMIGANDPAGWLLSYVEDFDNPEYTTHDINFHVQAGMTLREDQQHLLIFVTNPSAAKTAAQQANEQPQGQLLLYRVQIQP